MGELMNVKAVAKELRISEVRVRQLCQEGRIGSKVGRDWVITREELEAFKETPRPTGRPKSED